MEDWLPEQLKSCKNLCETAQILINVNRKELLPTQLELLLELVQQIVDENCVIRDEEILFMDRLP